jgi:hypothetical protein
MQFGEVKRAEELTEDKGYIFIQFDYELKEIEETLSKKQLVKEYGESYQNEDDQVITGAIVKVDEGDYTEIWITTENKPYMVNSMYELVYINGTPWWR